MDAGTIRAERLRSQRLSAPAATLAEAAAHMTATQSQEFWGGRWALAARTRGEPTLADVDAAFERGDLVRSWTQRGTLHIVAPRDLGWILSVTSARQAKQIAGMIGGDLAALDRAETTVRGALRGGNRLTRAEFTALLESSGVAPGGTTHFLWALAVRQTVVLGPVVPREGAPTREQYIVLADEWIADASAPEDPLAELFVRYIAAHGPAGVADFAWWATVPKTIAQAARAGAADRVVEVDDGLFVTAASRPRRAAGVAATHALPAFDEYYLSYADRTLACPPQFTATVGPSRNGLVRPILVHDGEVIGTWSHSMAVGAHHRHPVPEPFEQPASGVADGAAPGFAEDAASGVVDALARFRRFLDG